MKARIVFQWYSVLCKCFILLLILVTHNLFLAAQNDTSWFRLYAMDSLESMFPSGYESCGEDAVLIINASANFDDPPYHRSSLIRIDGENGDIVWQSKITHNPIAESSEVFFLAKGLIQLKDGSYVAFFDTKTEEGKVGFVINRFSENGSLNWNRDYGIPGLDILPLANSIGVGPDSMSFVVAARTLDLENPSSVINLFHIDAQGDVINQLALNTDLEYYSDFCPVAMLYDSSFVVGFNLGDFNFEGYKVTTQFSYSGQTLSSTVAWDFGYWVELKRHPSGNLVAISQSFSGQWDNRVENGMRTTFYSPSLDTIWSRVYNNFELPYYYRELDYPGPVSFDPDGNILVTGSGSAYDGVKPAHIIKYSADGIIQWIRRIGIGPDVCDGVQEIGGKIVFTPRGILLVGSLLDVNDMLLVRLDSAGCIGESTCDIDFLLETKDLLQNKFVDFTFSPNPTSDIIECSVAHEYFHHLVEPELAIFNMTGCICATIHLDNAVQRLNLAILPSGVYFGILRSKGIPVAIQKLIKL